MRYAETLRKQTYRIKAELFIKVLDTSQKKKEMRVRAIKDKNGLAITDPKKVKDRWKEHFEELYHGTNTADTEVLKDLPVSTADSDADDTPKLKREEIEAAISRMKSGKAPGIDNVTADEMRAAGTIGLDLLFKLFETVWEKEKIPEDWSRAVVVPIFKKKDKTVCDNYRGIRK